MQAAKFAVAGAIAVVAGCAAAPDAAPQAQCQYFAREEGMEWVQTVKSEAAAGGGTAVTMQLKDALGRSFNATCVYANGKKTWASPLPDNAISRQQGRDTIAPLPSK